MIKFSVDWFRAQPVGTIVEVLAYGNNRELKVLYIKQSSGAWSCEADGLSVNSNVLAGSAWWNNLAFRELDPIEVLAHSGKLNDN